MGFIIAIAIGWLLFELFRFRPPRGQLNCGIWGFSGSRPVDVTKLKWLAVDNQSRGTDSTGVYGNHLWKEQGPARRLVLMPGFNAAVKGAHTVQGHDRSASAGSSVTKENSHPFHFGHEEMEGVKWAAEVVGAHNGFIIPEMLRHHEEHFGFKKFFPVDSQVIFAALAKTGDVKCISEIEGAMAISFQILSDNPNKLYLYKRGDTRPLFIGEAPDGLYYSSIEESLMLIGCRSVWDINPHTLYTLEAGTIVDVYKMPFPKLKSLAANVTRANWRSGLSHAELGALPGNAGTQIRLPASGNASKFERDFGFGNNRGFSTNKNAVSERMGKEYHGKTSLDSKFNMLIKSVSDELKKLEAFDITPESIVTRDHQELASCALVIHVVKQEDNRGLPAWTVIAEDDNSIACMTSGNGITATKIPIAQCGKEITMLAYSPLDEFGPYAFKVKPEGARVVEVTLSIPFLKKGIKKTPQAPPDSESESHEGGYGLGEACCPIYPYGPQQEILYGEDKRSDQRILRSNAEQVSGGSEGQSSGGVLVEYGPFRNLVPETDDYEVRSSLDQRCKDSVIYLPKEQSLQIISLSLNVDSEGRYTAYKNIPEKLFLWSTSHPDRKIWYKYYADHFYNTIRTSGLVLDASRLMQRDRYMNKVWFPLWAYVELLLLYNFSKYVRTGTPPVDKADEHKYYPSVQVLKKRGHQPSSTQEEKEQGFLPYLVYMAFLNYLVEVVKDSDMTNDKIKTLLAYKERLANQVVNLNGLLLEAEENSNLTTNQREVIMEARNMMRLEYGDLQDYIEFCEKGIKHKEVDSSNID